MADFDTVFTEKECKSLINKCGINYDMGHFSFKPRLFFCKDNKKVQPLAMNTNTEMSLMSVIRDHQPVCKNLMFENVYNCKDLPFPYVGVSDILDNITTEANTCALVHRNNYYIELSKLMFISGKKDLLTAISLKSTRFYEALVTFMLAATHYNTIVPHLKWLCSSIRDEDYSKVVEMSQLEEILNTKSDKPFHIFTEPCAELPLTLYNRLAYPEDNVDTSDPKLGEMHLNQSALETLVFGIEVLNRIESIKDDTLRNCIYIMIRTGFSENSISKLMYTCDDTGMHITPDVQKIIDIADMEQRYYAIRDFTIAHEVDILAAANEYKTYGHSVNPMFCEFIKFCQSESVMNIRLKTTFILYNYVKRKGWLDELMENMHGNSNSIPIPGASAMGMSVTGTEVPETYSMMTFDHATHDLDSEAPSGDSSRDSAHKPDTGINFEELDRLTADFKSSKYSFKVDTDQSLDDHLRDSYTAISDKMSLLNKALIRSIKDIKVYNTGGKNIGKKTGKLDRKNLYKYKTSKDIFFDNTYKVKESDLAFGIILDVSGSMHGRGIEDGRATMIVLHETLKALNINHSIITHNSRGYHQSTIKRYQLFKEDKNFKCTKNYALAGIEARGGNCDSGALYYMEQCMRRVKNKDKICIMFSDGEPTECSETELKDQVRHMEQNGIKVIGVGINFPSIKEYYSNNANGRNLKEMFNIVSDILKQYVLEKIDKE